MISTFITDSGVEVPAVSAEQMREIDRIAIEETGPNLYQMMENAGRNLAQETISHLGPEWKNSPVVVLAGADGNGGGGICAARHLANRGVEVSLALSDETGLGDVPGQQLEVYEAAGGSMTTIDALTGTAPTLIVDALVGYSLRGAPRGAVLRSIEWANDSPAPVLSLDVPSGVDATTGETEGEHVEPTWTLTLALPKSGLVGNAVGSLALADIGIPAGVYHRAGIEVSPDVFGDSYVVHVSPGRE